MRMLLCFLFLYGLVIVTTGTQLQHSQDVETLRTFYRLSCWIVNQKIQNPRASMQNHLSKTCLQMMQTINSKNQKHKEVAQSTVLKKLKRHIGDITLLDVVHIRGEALKEKSRENKRQGHFIY